MRSLVIKAIFVVMTGVAMAADSDVVIRDVPDYRWHAGCFGTATGNLMGYWDRNGLADFYTGPTSGGFAPLHSRAPNSGIQSMWASEAGVDGRPVDEPGHINDYWRNEGYIFNGLIYESTEDDPYMVLGREEHEPDCIGDFIGLNQKKYTDMDGECDGNINAYSYVYWDKLGGKRVNYVPMTPGGEPTVDIQSGVRAWTQWRGYDCDVFTQLTDFNPETPPGTGFTFEDVKAEIDAGYPFMVFMQPYGQLFRAKPNMPKANPEIHGMLIYGYSEEDYYGATDQYVYYRTSWGDSCGTDCHLKFSLWSSAPWQAGLPVRGVIGFRPHPKVKRITRGEGNLTLEWDGPSSEVRDRLNNISRYPHAYVVERTDSLSAPNWTAVGGTTTDRAMTVPDSGTSSAFFRVRLEE